MKDIDELLKATNESIEVEYVEPAALLSKIESQEEEKTYKKPFWTRPKILVTSAIALASVVMAVVLPVSINFRKPINNVDSSGGAPNAVESNSFLESSKENEGYLITYPNSVEPLKQKAETPAFDNSENTSGFKSFINKLNRYSGSLMENLNVNLNPDKKNSAYSGASIFFALSMLAKTTSSQDKAKILSILNVTEDELNQYLPILFRACNRSYFDKNASVLGKERVDNSIWLDNKYNFNDEILEDLANNFYTNSFSGDFESDNKNVNGMISKYVDDCTEGLLKPNYEFSKETSFILLSSLFFQDTWNYEGVPLTQYGLKNFNEFGGGSKKTVFYSTYYEEGSIYETEKYTSMFAKTYHGFQIDFLLPKEGVSVDEVFKADVLVGHESATHLKAEMKNAGTKDEYVLVYLSRIAFPEFEASFDEDIKGTLFDTYDIQAITQFNDFASRKDGLPTVFNLSSVIHTTKVEMKKDSVVGAAATAEGPEGYGAPPVYYLREELVLDRPFVYTIKDPLGIKLFEGVVYNV